MPTSLVEHRSHRRVAFFRVPTQREQVPVWVFKPQDAAHAIAGLVMNLSEGGLQVLTGAADEPDGVAFEIQLLLGESEAVPRFRGRVTRVWTRESASAGWLSGFHFVDEHSSAEAFIRRWQADMPERRWVRCLLVSTGLDSGRSCDILPAAPVFRARESALVTSTGRIPAGWGAPRHLGDVVNSVGSDAQARLSPDGRTLYFSSERRSPAPADRDAAWNNGKYNIWQVQLAACAPGGGG